MIGPLFAQGIPAMGGLLPFYLAFTGTLFLPLTVPYIGGALRRRASKWSGMAAVSGGFLVGAVLMLLSDHLPAYLAHPMSRPYWSFGTAWAAFFLCTWMENRVAGPIPPDSVAGTLNRHELGAPGTPDEVSARIERMIRPDPRIAKLSGVPNPGTPPDLSFLKRPSTWENITLIVLIMVLVRWW